MKVTLEINLGNDAMQTYRDIRLALDKVIHQMMSSQMGYRTPRDGDGHKIMDLNGNSVGKWEVIETRKLSAAQSPHTFEPSDIDPNTCAICGKYKTYRKYH